MNRKILIGCINNNLGRSNTIKTRFFTLDDAGLKDVTEDICCGVNAKKISNFKYNKGLANYSFGCGLSHYLQNDNLNLIGLNGYKIEMFTLKDIKHILKCKNAFDDNIKIALNKYYN